MVARVYEQLRADPVPQFLAVDSDTRFHRVRVVIALELGGAETGTDRVFALFMGSAVWLVGQIRQHHLLCSDVDGLSGVDRNPTSRVGR